MTADIITAATPCREIYSDNVSYNACPRLLCKVGTDLRFFGGCARRVCRGLGAMKVSRILSVRFAFDIGFATNRGRYIFEARVA